MSEKEKELNIVTIGDLLEKTTDETGEGKVVKVKGIGNMRLKMMKTKLRSQLQKRAATGKDEQGNLKVDESEFARLMVEACVVEPKIPQDKLAEMGEGYLTQIVKAINKISGYEIDEEDAQANSDF